MYKFFKNCCIFKSCRKKEPLLDNYYEPNIIEDNSEFHTKENTNFLQTNVYQPETIMYDQNITKCGCISLCKHSDCDFNLMITTIKSLRKELKEIKDSYLLGDYKQYLESKETIIVELNNNIRVKDKLIRNLQKSNVWYEQHKKVLEVDIKYYQNSVTVLSKLQKFYKNESKKLKLRLASKRLYPILE